MFLMRSRARLLCGDGDGLVNYLFRRSPDEKGDVWTRGHDHARLRERFVNTKQRTRRSCVNYRRVTTMPTVYVEGGRSVRWSAP